MRNFLAEPGMASGPARYAAYGTPTVAAESAMQRGAVQRFGDALRDVAGAADGMPLQEDLPPALGTPAGRPDTDRYGSNRSDASGARPGPASRTPDDGGDGVAGGSGADAPDSYIALLQGAWLAGEAPMSPWPGAVTVMPFVPPGGYALESTGQGGPDEASPAGLSEEVLPGQTTAVPPRRGADPARIAASMPTQPAAPMTNEPPSSSRDPERVSGLALAAAGRPADAHPAPMAFPGAAAGDMTAAGLRAGDEAGMGMGTHAAVARAGRAGLEGTESGAGWDRMSMDRPGAPAGMMTGGSSAAAAQWAGPSILNLKPPSGEPSLATILGERLHYQITRRSEHAVLRLDPPSMGSIEILIRHEAGGLQVQLRASHAEVARQLHGIGENLRQDLAQRQHGEVSVLVHDGSRDADGRQRQRHAPWQQTPGRALHDGTHEQGTGPFAMNAEA